MKSNKYFLGFLSAFAIIAITAFLVNSEISLKLTTGFKNKKNIHNSNEKYVLSYSLFGKNSWKLYGENVIEVAKDSFHSNFYKNWTIRIYHENFPPILQSNLTKEFPNLRFVNIKQSQDLNLSLIKSSIKNINRINGMTWRFLPIADLHVDVMCSRDLDSPLFKREEDAVKEWLDSGKIMHVMRDRPVHGVNILGGLWCFKNIKNRLKGQEILKKLLEKAQPRTLGKEAAKGDDQNVLGNYMWPLIRNDVMQHDSYLCQFYPGSIPFPSKREKGYFTGCIRPCPDKPIQCPTACRPKNHHEWIYC